MKQNSNITCLRLVIDHPSGKFNAYTHVCISVNYSKIAKLKQCLGRRFDKINTECTCVRWGQKNRLLRKNCSLGNMNIPFVANRTIPCVSINSSRTLLSAFCHAYSWTALFPVPGPPYCVLLCHCNLPTSDWVAAPTEKIRERTFLTTQEPSTILVISRLLKS